jgi:uncharacterized protein YecT (DUF1311 family)
MIMKKCSICEEKLNYRNKSGLCKSHFHTLTHSCNSCNSLISRFNKSGLCLKCKNAEYYQENKERLNTHYNNVYHQNKETINKKRAQREKIRFHSDPDFKLKKSLRSRFKKAMRENWSSGSFTETLGCSIVELKSYLASKFKPGMTWDNYGKEWQIDHIIPFCSLDLNVPGNLEIVAHYSNLQPLWNSDHYNKTTVDRNNKK